jgi:uncharacterized repeat protein (TIGR02059 family)
VKVAGSTVALANNTPVFVDSSAKTVTLSLASAVVFGQSVTVSYTDPSSGDDKAAIQDAVGNDAISLTDQSVTNLSPEIPDTIAPVFASATVNANKLVLTYGEALDAANAPPASAFAVTVNAASALAPLAVAVDATAKTITLTLATVLSSADSVKVSYTDPTTGNDAKAIQDVAGNDAATLTNQSATNNTPAPSLASLPGLWQGKLDVLPASAALLPAEADGAVPVWLKVFDASGVAQRLVKARLIASNGTVTASGKSYAFSAGANSVTVSPITFNVSSATAKSSVGGTLVNAGATEVLNLTTYGTQYDTPANLADWVGSWSSVSGTGTVSWTLANAGIGTLSVIGSGSGTGIDDCSYTGQISSRAEQKALVNVSLTQTCNVSNVARLQGVATLAGDKLSANLTLVTSDDLSAALLTLRKP